MRKYRITAAIVAAVAVAPTDSSADTLIGVNDTVVGKTLKYSGANTTMRTPCTAELSGYFAGMGANVVRVNHNDIRDSVTPFDGKTPEQVKADPNVLDWSAVASWFSYDESWLAWGAKNGVVILPQILWNRNRASVSTCEGGEFQFRTESVEDENVFWVAVFALGYWANVKNDFGLTHMEISNEPDNCGGNGATQIRKQDHNRMIQLTKDALQYVNRDSGLVNPPLPAVVMGPGVLTETTGWVSSALADPKTAGALDRVSWHSYWDHNLFAQVRDSASDVAGRSRGKKQWITEWGQWWHPTGYSDSGVVKDMAPAIVQAGLWDIEAQLPWNIVDECCGYEAAGLVRSTGEKTRLFWDMKMLHRALLSEKDVLDTSLPNAGAPSGADGAGADTTFAWATRDGKAVYLVLMNHLTTPDPIVFDLSALPGIEGKTGTVYKVLGGAGPYSEQTDPPLTVTSGKLSFVAAADAHYVVVIDGAGAPADAGVDGPTPRPASGDAAAPRPGSASEGGAPVPAATADPENEVLEDEQVPPGNGCSCSATGRASRSAWMWLSALALAIGCRRRRGLGLVSRS